MKKNILITGANGQLGNSIKSISYLYPQYNYNFASHQDLDITNLKQVENILKSGNYYVINCAAYTNVNKAEEKLESLKATQVNETGVINIIKCIEKFGGKLIHISTDFVFDGFSEGNCLESTELLPLNQYGKTKMYADKAILFSEISAIIYRVSWTYSEYGNNFITKVIDKINKKEELKIVEDVIGCPTYTVGLAKVIMDNLNKIKDYPELYNYSDGGSCSRYDFAKEILNILKEYSINGIKLSGIKSYSLNEEAKRPTNVVLNKTKIKKEFDIDIPHWKDNLKICLGKIKENGKFTI